MSQGRRYRILSILGQGGFGTVYRARLLGEGGFSKTVALKVLNPEVAASSELARRLRDEARVLGLVQHRAIVKVDTLVCLEGRWTIVMEYVEGPDLRLTLERVGALPPGVALELGAEVAAALHAAWNATGPDGAPLRLLHRDIKPANLCLTAQGEVKILDFGIARADFGDRESNTQSQSFGTPDYMAPERFLFENGPASDVYALGATLYELLGNERLGRASPNERIHQELMSGRLEALQHRLGDARDDLIQLLRDMLAYAPEDRPTARDAERRMVRLRHADTGLLLRDWAELAVSPLASQLELRADATTGNILAEGSEVSAPRDGRWPAPAGPVETSTFAFAETAAGNPTLVAPGDLEPVVEAPPPPVAPPRAPRLAGLGALALLLAGVGVWAAVRLRAPTPPPAPPPTATPEVATAPAAPPPSEPPAPAPDPRVVSAPAPAAPEAAPTTPRSAATAPASAPATAPSAAPTVAAAPAADPPADPPEAAAASGVAGAWEGTLGGRSFDLTLSGAGESVRGRITVHFGGNGVENAVTGRYDAAAGRLTLKDAEDVPDAGRYVIALENGEMSGHFESNDGSTRVLLVGWRAK